MYRYRGAGSFDRVHLRNGYEARRLLSGREGIWIEDIFGLHRAVVTHLCEVNRSLTPKELKFLRKEQLIAQEDGGDFDIVIEHCVSSDSEPDRILEFEWREGRWFFVP